MVTTPTWQRSYGRPCDRIMPLSFSNTAASTARFIRMRWPASQLAWSPVSTWRRSRNRPSLHASPVCLPESCSRRATSLATTVLPLLPVMPTTGMRPSSALPSFAAGNRWSTIAGPTGRGVPSAGLICISRPGPAFTSTMAPRWSASGREMSSATRSTPAISSPTTRAASAACAATLGCTRSVTSKATLPLRWIRMVLPAGATESPSSSPWRFSSSRAAESSRTRFSGWSSVLPRRGSELICDSIRSSMVEVPSPTTLAVSPIAAATSRPPTTSRRCSLPGTKRSTITPLPSSMATE
ncbi:hypothetical protein D3C86_1311430 [compost metagenome]